MHACFYRETIRQIEMQLSRCFADCLAVDISVAWITIKAQSLINANTIIDQLNDHYRALRPRVTAIKEDRSKLTPVVSVQTESHEACHAIAPGE